MIEVSNLAKKFRLYQNKPQSIKARVVGGQRIKQRDVLALDDISFSIGEGESVGIIGANGCGKSTLFKCLAGIYPPTLGEVFVEGRLSALIELGAGFHPELTGLENIYLNGSILGLNKKEINKKLDQIVEFSGLDKFIYNPVRNYSSGMTVRLGFSIASNVDSDVLLIDEVLAVGDQEFQQRCLAHLAKFKKAGGTLLLVSHGMDQIRNACDRTILIDHGKIIGDGPSHEVVDSYLSSVPGVDEEKPSDARWGTGEARIGSITLRNMNGSETSTVHTGRNGSFEVLVEPSQSIDDLVLGMRIDALDGTRIWSTNTAMRGVKLPSAKEHYLVRFDFKSLPLLPGRYDLTVGLGDDAGHKYDHWEKCRSFEVVADQNTDFFRVWLDGEFQVLG
jgi:ABC-type polysaccharide/polyol phosphate transport system ATPase subunit